MNAESVVFLDNTEVCAMIEARLDHDTQSLCSCDYYCYRDRVVHKHVLYFAIYNSDRQQVEEKMYDEYAITYDLAF